MDITNGWIIAFSVIASISSISSLAVIFTLVFFPCLRTKIFMKLVAFISVGDFLATWVYIAPIRPPTHSWYCQVQGFFMLTGMAMSWLWTTVLTYFMYSLVIKNRLPENELPFHIISWLYPIASTALYYIIAPFAADKDNRMICIIEAGNDNAVIYKTITTFGVLFACIIVQAIMAYYVIYAAATPENYLILKLAKKVLLLYPLLLFLDWTPVIIMQILQFSNQINTPSAKTAYIITQYLRITHGLLTAIVFFSNSPQARKKWSSVFFGFHQNDENDNYNENEDSFGSRSQNTDVSEAMQNLRRSSLMIDSSTQFWGLDEKFCH